MTGKKRETRNQQREITRITRGDPLAGIRLAKMKKTDGIHAWSEEEIARFREHFPPGAKPRLALELLLNTGHARGEVVRMGRQHIDKTGKLSMRRGKTGVAFAIPLLPGLLAELELHPKSNELTFLTTERGRPFKTAASFGTMFKRWCHEARLPHCSTHGLRKASAIRHALKGATAPELMAWHGWKSISEAQRYIEEANRILLSESVAAKLIAAELRTKTDQQVSTPNPG